MPPFRIGYNIDAQHSHLGANMLAAADDQVALHSAFTLVLDDWKEGKWYFTKQIQARSQETQVIHRRYWVKDPNIPNSGGWDGSLHRAPGISAEGIIGTLQAAQQAGGVKVIEQIYCEPDVHGAELTTMIKLNVDCIKEASARGMRLCVLNIQTVVLTDPLTGKSHELDAGMYDPLLFALAQYPEHFLGIHEYGLGDLWCNTSNDLIGTLDDGMPVPYDFTKDSDAKAQAQYIARPREAHLGRVELIKQRCKLIGVPMPKVVYTEIGWDNVRLGVQPAVERMNGRAPMGYPTLDRYWQVRYPQWTKAQTAFEQVKWLNRAMPDYVVGACLFGKDTAFENAQYHLEDADFQQQLWSYSRTVRGVTTPTPQPPPVVTLPPTIPDEPKRNWRGELELDERSVLSLMKDGKLGAIEKLVLHMTDILDELTEHEGHEG